MRHDFDEDADPDRLRPVLSYRTSYRCKAQECPNAGTLGGAQGVNDSGLCYAHYVVREEPGKWREVTAEIKADFEHKRNFGTRRGIGDALWSDTPGQDAMRKAVTGRLGRFAALEGVEARSDALRESGDIPAVP